MLFIPLPQRGSSLDLDDGVKVNYVKLGAILEPVKSLNKTLEARMTGPITSDKLTQKQIQKAFNTIKKKYDIKQVILFGSKARDLPDKESDIDFCVIIEEPKKRLIEIAREVRKELRNYISAPLDVLVSDEKKFYERASLCITLEASILKEGIEL